MTSRICKLSFYLRKQHHIFYQQHNFLLILLLNFFQFLLPSCWWNMHTTTQTSILYTMNCNYARIHERKMLWTLSCGWRWVQSFKPCNIQVENHCQSQWKSCIFAKLTKVQCALLSTWSRITHETQFLFIFLFIKNCIGYTSGSQCVLWGSQGICNQFPGDPWIHFSNSYFVVY